MTSIARSHAGTCRHTAQTCLKPLTRQSICYRRHQCMASCTSSSSSRTTHATAKLQEQQQQQQQLAPYTRSNQQQQTQQQWLQNGLMLSAAALMLTTTGPADAAQPLHLVSELDAAAAHTLESILRPLFAAFTVLYIIRITMTWYPSIDGTKLPWLLAYAPTEPILKVTRNVIPLVGGVDITPIVWVALISFFNEILLGPQGILMLIQRESGAGLL